MNPGESHSEIHGGKGEIYQAQIQDRGKTIAFDGNVVFSQPVANQGCGKFSAQGAPDKEGCTGAQHRPGPDHHKSPVGTKDSRSHAGEQCAR